MLNTYITLIKVVAVISTALIGLCSVYVWKNPHDEPLEEHMELIIKDITGMDIDLTPTSQEKGNKNENIS